MPAENTPAPFDAIPIGNDAVAVGKSWWEIVMDGADFALAAELAGKLAYAQFVAGCNVYAPEQYRRKGKTLGFGDCGAREAIKSGDPEKMRAALAALKEYADG